MRGSWRSSHSSLYSTGSPFGDVSRPHWPQKRRRQQIHERMTAESQRLRDTQSPIIPVIADLIRSCPGTISLGQGVVGYGPPPDTLAHIEQFLADPVNHKY